MNQVKSTILLLLIMSLIGCGGGESSDSTPKSTVADFPIGDNTTLVRYQNGDYIKYDIKATWGATESNQAGTATGTYTINYSYSSDPSTFRDSAAETMTKSHTQVINGQAQTYTQEAIQLPEDWDDTPSTDERVYTEQVDGHKIILGYTKKDDGSYGNYGQLSLPGSPYIGYHYTNNVLKEEQVGSSKAYHFDVFHELTINRQEMVQTAIGTFDTYVVEFTYTETRRDGVTNSKIGKYWLHPAIGIIKEESTETIGSLSSGNDVTDFEYSIASTNLSY